MSKNAAGVEVFRGFNIKYPEYSVVTPHTLQEYTIRALTVGEEEKLKASLLTPNKLAEHLNEVIWECLVKKPENIKSYQDFMNKNTIKDRDALMYGLYHVTYKDIHNYDVTCVNCEYINSIKVDFLKSLKAVMWPKDEKESMIDKKVPVKFEIADMVTAIIRQPMLIDEFNLLKDNAFTSEEVRDLNMQLLVIDKFEVDKEGAKTPDTVEDRDNILKGYKELPSTDRKMIDKVYEEEFGKYGIDVATRVRCQKCGHEEDISLDLVRQFFRSIYE
jgi:hypothetical protein